MKMVKCLPEFEYFTVFLKKRNFISKIRRSKVTYYAALKKIELFIIFRPSTFTIHYFLAQYSLLIIKKVIIY